MSDAALQPRLDAIERRQRYLLALLVYPYLAAITWVATRQVPVAVVAPVVVWAVCKYLVALYRARFTSERGDGTGGDESTPAGET